MHRSYLNLLLKMVIIEEGGLNSTLFLDPLKLHNVSPPSAIGAFHVLSRFSIDLIRIHPKTVDNSIRWLLVVN